MIHNFLVLLSNNNNNNSNKKVHFRVSQTAVFWFHSKKSPSCCLASASDWHPGQPLPLRVQWGSDTCVAWALCAPSALHIHQPVSLSAGQFIINSCWLVKSGPGRGTHTYIYIHCEDPLAMDGFQRPWTHPLSLNDGHSPESSNTYSVNLLSPSPPSPSSFLSLPLTWFLSLSFFSSSSCSAPSATMSGTFALSPVRLACEEAVWKWSVAVAGPLLCVFVMPV